MRPGEELLQDWGADCANELVHRALKHTAAEATTAANRVFRLAVIWALGHAIVGRLNGMQRFTI